MPWPEVPKPISKLSLSVVGQSSQDQETVGRQRAIRRPLTPKAALHEMANLPAVRATRVAAGGGGVGGEVGPRFLPPPPGAAVCRRGTPNLGFVPGAGELLACL